jgi:hypothetical protein
MWKKRSEIFRRFARVRLQIVLFCYLCHRQNRSLCDIKFRAGTGGIPGLLWLLQQETAGKSRVLKASDCIRLRFGAGVFSKPQFQNGTYLAFCFRSLWKRALLHEKYVAKPI